MNLIMSASDLERWMELTGKTPVDIASALKIDPTTVKRFLKGKKVRRIILDALERLVAQNSLPDAGTTRVAG